jgi:3-deoxy-D-manno-octulosonic-acid transferase
LYFSVLRIAALFNPKAKLFVSGRKNLLANIRYALIDERRPRIWMHCASLGEFEQGKPVLEKLRQQYPHFALVLTFFSPSGYEVRKEYPGVDYVFYLPADSPYNAKRFLRYIKPELAIFVKYEFWYFLLSQVARQQIPCILISSVFRKDQPFFKWYGSLHRHMLQTFTHIFTQDVASAELVKKTGMYDVTVAGDTRFDTVIESVRSAMPLPIAEQFCGEYKILVAGSTWEEDEALLVKALEAFPPSWKLILVPHEVDEAHIRKIEALFDGQTDRWSAWNGQTSKRVLLVDQVGFLLHLYRFADVAWIGGGFGKEGVHNVLEAAVYGIPVLHGPVYDHFLEAVELVKTGGALEIATNQDIMLTISNWERDRAAYEQACRAAKNHVYSKAGATSAILDYLSEKKTLSVR